jgi:hypothetical protein
MYPYQGEGRGEGGFEADTLTNFGSAIGITKTNSSRTGRWGLNR